MMRITLYLTFVFTLFFNNSGSMVNKDYECHENNRVIKLKKEVLDKIISKDVRGDWQI